MAIFIGLAISKGGQFYTMKTSDKVPNKTNLAFNIKELMP
jgi:hypothetical protein